MGFAVIVNGYLEEAREIAGTQEGQLAALGEERKKLWTEVKGGDWESISSSFSGSSASYRRGIDAMTRLRAVRQAIVLLENDADTKGMASGPIIPVFKNSRCP